MTDNNEPKVQKGNKNYAILEPQHEQQPQQPQGVVQSANESNFNNNINNKRSGKHRKRRQKSLTSHNSNSTYEKTSSSSFVATANATDASANNIQSSTESGAGEVATPLDLNSVGEPCSDQSELKEENCDVSSSADVNNDSTVKVKVNEEPVVVAEPNDVALNVVPNNSNNNNIRTDVVSAIVEPPPSISLDDVSSVDRNQGTNSLETQHSSVDSSTVEECGSAANEEEEAPKCSDYVVGVVPCDRIPEMKSIDLEDSDDRLLLQLEHELGVTVSSSIEQILSTTNSRLQKNGLEAVNSQDKFASLEIVYQEQTKELERLRAENRKLHLELSENECTASETTADIYEVQMAALEKTIIQLQKENDSLHEKLCIQEETAQITAAKVQQEFTSQLETLRKQIEVAQKEKEAIVMKYAQSEMEVLMAQKAFEDVEKKLKESLKEKENLLTKMRILTTERSRLTQSFDSKMAELRSSQREVEKLKEDLSSRDIKIKWAQNKLKTESDSHKETQLKLEKVLAKLQETREETEQIRKDCQEMVRTYQESEEFKSSTLDVQLRERESELKVERQEKSNHKEVCIQMKEELVMLRGKHKSSLEENNALTFKVQCLERERLEYEHNLSRLKETISAQKQELVDVQDKLGEIENLRLQMEREKEKLSASLNEIERLRQANADLQIDMEACRHKEGDLLEFTEKLTRKNVLLQSEHSCLEAKNQALDREHAQVKKLCEDLERQNTTIVTQLEEEKQQRLQETQLLARKLAEKTKSAETLGAKLEEESNEKKILRRKLVSTVKDLTRELQQARKKLDVFESRTGGSEGHSLGSRTSSNGSLDTLVGNCNSNSNNLLMLNRGSMSSESHQPPDTSLKPVSPPEPDKQTMIERIVKLQKSHARKNEKIEFLEEHVNQLQMELKKKHRIIQQYVMREETGTLSTDVMDQNKMELSKKGGIMASLYGSSIVDGAMTMDLSLEINHKLQAVLEDTLLKNITLKESINTLGEEIARLEQDNCRQQIKSRT